MPAATSSATLLSKVLRCPLHRAPPLKLLWKDIATWWNDWTHYNQSIRMGVQKALQLQLLFLVRFFNNFKTKWWHNYSSIFDLIRTLNHKFTRKKSIPFSIYSKLSLNQLFGWNKFVSQWIIKNYSITIYFVICPCLQKSQKSNIKVLQWNQWLKVLCKLRGILST